MRCHRNGDMNDYVEFRIHMEELPDGLYQGLIDKGAQLLVKETVDKQGNECRPHFQGIGLVNKSTFRNLMKAYCTGNKMYSVGVLKTHEDWETFFRYLCKGRNEHEMPDVLYIEDDLMMNIQEQHQKYWEIYNGYKESNKKRKRQTKGALEDCYNTIKKKLNSKSSAAAIGTSIMRWYIDQKRVLPGAFQMNGMISTYTAWMNDAEEEDKLNDYDLFRKIYNRLELV